MSRFHLLFKKTAKGNTATKIKFKSKQSLIYQ